MIRVDEKTIKIPRLVDIAKTHDGTINFGNHREMTEKRFVPFLQINTPARPRIKLSRRIIRFFNGVNRLVENVHKRFAIGWMVLS